MGERRSKATFVEFHPFFDCCSLTCERLRAADYELSLVKQGGEDQALQRKELSSEIHRLVVSAPMFASATLESFINHYADYGIEGDAWRTQDEIQSLSLSAKWIVVPFLARGSELDTKSPSFNEFLELVRARNSFTHPKPTWVYEIKDNQHYKRHETKFENRSEDRKRVAKRADTIIVNLVQSLAEIDDSAEFQQLAEKHNIPLGQWK